MGSVVKAMAVVAAQLWPGARLTGEVASAFSTHTNSLQGRIGRIEGCSCVGKLPGDAAC